LSQSLDVFYGVNKKSTNWEDFLRNSIELTQIFYKHKKQQLKKIALSRNHRHYSQLTFSLTDLSTG
ncbi:hypothetical protein, partial [Shewanella sp.]|uniref:hypothetical protein n=1 Tax=Shewanella sp. TaxID=50422 RepID=UPI000E92E1B4